MTSSGCSMEGGPPKKETVLTVLGVAYLWNSFGDGKCFIFQDLGISNRTKPKNSECALRVLSEFFFRICSGFGSGNAKPYLGHLQDSANKWMISEQFFVSNNLVSTAIPELHLLGRGSFLLFCLEVRRSRGATWPFRLEGEGARLPLASELAMLRCMLCSGRSTEKPERQNARGGKPSSGVQRFHNRSLSCTV